MGREGPETRLITRARKKAIEKYGPDTEGRLIWIKHHGSQFARAGVSDLICCLDGVFVAIEVKAPESYGNSVERALEQGPSVKQREFVRKVRLTGGVAGFAATEEQILAFFEEAEQAAKKKGKKVKSNGTARTE